MVPLAEVLRRYWARYERQFRADILPSHRRAVQAILNCRTAVLGGQVYLCTHCQREHYVYHSCNHRACPQCGQADAGQWIEEQTRKLLPVPYYLITFTMAAGLRSWLRSNQKIGYAALLKASAAALQDVARREKYLGAELGILSMLHTWGRQLQYHPHVHCVVAAGGLRRDRLRWCRPRSNTYFLPQRVLAARFRTLLKAALREHHASIPAAVWKQNWVVDVQSVGGGQGALRYLAAYVCRTALGSQRIIAADDGYVSFKYRDNKDRGWRTLRLEANEFIRRFLQHVLPRRFQRVRHYGWISAAAATKWQRIMALLDWRVANLKPPVASEYCCKHCGFPLRWIVNLGRAPPTKGRL